MQPIEVTAKKVDDAIKEGLRILDTTLDKVEYKVISSGGLFKKAKVLISLLEDDSTKNVSEATRKKPQEKPRETFGQKIPKEPQNSQSKPQKEQQSKPQREPRESSQREPREQSRPQREPREPREQSRPQRDSREPREQSRPQREPREPREQQRPQREPREQQSRPQREQKPKSEKKPLREEVDAKRRVRSENITEEEVKSAVAFMTTLLRLMGMEAEVKSQIVGGDLILDLVSQNGALIGYRGETLDALEYLVSIHVNKSNEKYISIVVDSCGYRQKREKMLVAMAEKAAARCIKTNRKVIMEPMNRSSRKIVHSTLSQYDNITSRSEGTEPNRHIIIFFKREKKS